MHAQHLTTAICIPHTNVMHVHSFGLRRIIPEYFECSSVRSRTSITNHTACNLWLPKQQVYNYVTMWLTAHVCPCDGCTGNICICLNYSSSFSICNGKSVESVSLIHTRPRISSNFLWSSSELKCDLAQCNHCMACVIPLRWPERLTYKHCNLSAVLSSQCTCSTLPAVAFTCQNPL